jgi:hypothetical protein
MADQGDLFTKYIILFILHLLWKLWYYTLYIMMMLYIPITNDDVQNRPNINCCGCVNVSTNKSTNKCVLLIPSKPCYMHMTYCIIFQVLQILWLNEFGQVITGELCPSTEYNYTEQ